MINGEISVRITRDTDIVTIRQRTFWFAKQIGFSGSWPTVVSTLVSGIARDILMSHLDGRIYIDTVRSGEKYGISITSVKIFNDKYGYKILPGENILYKREIDYSKLKANQIIDEYDMQFLNNNENNIKITKWLN